VSDLVKGLSVREGPRHEWLESSPSIYWASLGPIPRDSTRHSITIRF
jgi:hypothetical protein